jgi:integrase/recombinase XerD
LELDPDDVNQFLCSVAKEKTASITYFRHTVCGLRFFFRLYGLEDGALRLPRLSNDGKLLVVLSCEELRCLLFVRQRLNRRGPAYQRMSADLNFEVE